MAALVAEGIFLLWVHRAVVLFYNHGVYCFVCGLLFNRFTLLLLTW